MKSCIYECRVVHERFSPKSHRFRYGIFMFCLDLDEIDNLVKRIPFLSRNRFNLYSFHDRDHVENGSPNVREHLLGMLRARGVDRTVGRVLLVTNLRILGYVFNPVSFFYCFDETEDPLAVVAVVNNTYGETRSYVITHAGLDREGTFTSRQKKHFYISPFIQLDSELDLHVSTPSELLSVTIDDYIGEEKVLTAILEGERQPLTSYRLGWLTLKYPLLTAKVILAIHWEALQLWLKRVPFIRKKDHPELQHGAKRSGAVESRPAWRAE